MKPRYIGYIVGALILSINIHTFCGFDQNTLIHTKYGLVPIKDIKLQDQVITYNSDTGFLKKIR